jgi:hypothetical protein
MFPWIAICALAAGSVIDRIAVSVGNRVITASDVEREIRVTAFLNGTKPDLSAAARRTAAARLVEQTLVRLAVDASRYPAVGAADVKPALEDFRKKHEPKEADYQRALADYGITEQNVLNELIWERTLLTYIDIRFRPSVQVSDKEIQDYFDQIVKPAAVAAHPGEVPALDEYRDRIEETLAGKKEDEELSRWLAQAKQRYAIVYHDEAFK